MNLLKATVKFEVLVNRDYIIVVSNSDNTNIVFNVKKFVRQSNSGPIYENIGGEERQKLIDIFTNSVTYQLMYIEIINILKDSKDLKDE